MKKKNKGFTLIELLAVIVILGIILTIVVTNVVKYINDAKKGAFKDEAKKIANQVTNQLALKELGQTDKVTCDTTSDCKEIYDINDNNYEMKVVESSGNYFLHLIGKGSYSSVNLESSDCLSGSKCYNNNILHIVEANSELTSDTKNKINKYMINNIIVEDIQNKSKEIILKKGKINISNYNWQYKSGAIRIKPSDFLGNDYKYLDNDGSIVIDSSNYCNDNNSQQITFSILNINGKVGSFDYVSNYQDNLSNVCYSQYNNIKFCIDNKGEITKPTQCF